MPSLVIGAGPAGVAAARHAARGGASVILVDEHPVDPGLFGLDTPFYWGGRQTAAVNIKARMLEQVFAARPAVESALDAGVEVELGVACWGAWTPGHGMAALPEPLAGLADESRAWMVGFRRLILATGARDVALAFSGWDQPGVMGARAFNCLAGLYDAFAGRRLIILGSGDLALETALLATERGLEIAALIEVEQAAQGSPALVAAVGDAGVEVITGAVPVRAGGGREGVECLTIRSQTDGRDRTLSADTIVEAISLTPVVDLLDVVGARLTMQPMLGGHAPFSADGVATSRAEVFIAGDLAGVPGGAHRPVAEAEASGRAAAAAALASLGLATLAEPSVRPASAFDAVVYQQAWARALLASGEPEVVLCQCEEVTRGALLGVRQPAYLGSPPAAMARRDLTSLLADGPVQPDQIKRLTRAGMGPCQGRRCREQVALTLACAANDQASHLPLASYRAPVRPLPLKVLAAWDEPVEMSRNWDVWYGIPGQWTPYADIGTEHEGRYADILGGDLHL